MGAVVLITALDILTNTLVVGPLGDQSNVGAYKDFNPKDDQNPGLKLAKSKVVEFLKNQAQQQKPYCDVSVTLPDNLTVKTQTVSGINYKLQWAGTEYHCQPKGENGGKVEKWTDEKRCLAIYTYVNWDKTRNKFHEEPNCT